MNLINKDKYAMVATVSGDFYIGYVATVDKDGIGLLEASLVQRVKRGITDEEITLERTRQSNPQLLYPLNPSEVRVVCKIAIRWFPMSRVEWVSPWEHPLPPSPNLT